MQSGLAASTAISATLALMPGPPYTVLLVDDDIDVRRMLRLALRGNEVLEVVAEAADEESALELAAKLQPDVVVLDLDLADIRGVDVLSRLRSAVDGVRVVVYAGPTHDERSTVVRDGASGVVSKSEDLPALLRVLADVVARPARHRVAFALPNDPSSPGAARRLVTQACEEWGCEGVIDAAALVVTELVTNALVHADSSCYLRVGLRDGLLRLEVDDAGTGTPDLQPESEVDEHGRGLVLVSGVAMSWGIDPQPVGKTVWAELPVG